MAKGEIPLTDGDEYDLFTGWRQFYKWKPGQRRKTKRRYNKRVRRHAKRQIGRSEE